MHAFFRNSRDALGTQVALIYGDRVLMLALGIGATTPVFSLMNPILIHLLPERRPQRLAYMHLTMASTLRRE